MKFSSMNLFSIIIIVFVVFILFLSSPVYKTISGEGRGFGSRFLEGMTTGANEMGLSGAGTSGSPFLVPATLIVRPGDSNWKQKIDNNNMNETGITAWSIDNQFKTTGPAGTNQIGNQYQYFAEWWLAKLNATPGQLYSADVKANNYSNTNTLSDYGQYTFLITSVNSDGSSNYSGTFNGTGWGWTSSPPPAPYVNPNPTPTPAPTPTPTPTPTPNSSGPTIPDPTPGAKAKFAAKKCNIASKRDGNCIPVCVPISGGKVVGPPTNIYGDGGPFKNIGPDGNTFDTGTANYFYNMSTKYAWLGTPGEYYPITDPSVSRVVYGSDTDCTQNYACSAGGLSGSDGVSANCNPAPSPPSPSGGCDPSCTKVLNPFDANGQNNSTCSYNKDSGYTCSACPVDNNGEIDCNNFEICSGCGSDLTAYFGPDWQPDGRSGPSDQPYTPTECEAKCKKPDVQTFQSFLNNFRDDTGFSDGSCKIIGRKRNMIKCKPIKKMVGANDSNKPFFSPPSECILCNEKDLQGYATFKRKWDNYTKENNYVDVTIVSGPGDGGDGGGGGGGGKWSKRGAKYGPYSGGGGGAGGWGSGGGSAWGNWGSWNGDGGDGGWRGNRGYGGGGGGGDGGGWYQSLSDAKNKSFQVAASNAESSRQQAYIESLKLELNKINDEYTTQQAAVNKMKKDIDKMVAACQNANSKLNDAMRSNVSDNMNKNSAITLKEKIDANAKSGNIAILKQNVKMSCDNANQVNISYGSALQQLKSIDTKRQALIEKLVIAMNSVTENKTTININLGGMRVGGAGNAEGDCGDRLGCGQGINNNNMYPHGYFKKQRYDDSYNYNNIPMPYQDVILF
jgi:hypothetical protein